MELTGRQQEIWTFLVDYVDRIGYPPTVREIGEAVGLASPSTVHAHLAPFVLESVDDVISHPVAKRNEIPG